jgi:hypothetical protein
LETVRLLEPEQSFQNTLIFTRERHGPVFPPAQLREVIVVSDSESGCTDRIPQTGRRATIRVCYTVEVVASDVLMPIDCDEGMAADLHLFATGAWDDAPGERDLVHAEVLDEEPVYQDEFDWEEAARETVQVYRDAITDADD